MTTKLSNQEIVDTFQAALVNLISIDDADLTVFDNHVDVNNIKFTDKKTNVSGQTGPFTINIKTKTEVDARLGILRDRLTLLKPFASAGSQTAAHVINQYEYTRNEAITPENIQERLNKVLGDILIVDKVVCTIAGRHAKVDNINFTDNISNIAGCTGPFNFDLDIVYKLNASEAPTIAGLERVIDMLAPFIAGGSVSAGIAYGRYKAVIDLKPLAA